MNSISGETSFKHGRAGKSSKLRGTEGVKLFIVGANL